MNARLGPDYVDKSPSQVSASSDISALPSVVSSDISALPSVVPGGSGSRPTPPRPAHKVSLDSRFETRTPSVPIRADHSISLPFSSRSNAGSDRDEVRPACVSITSKKPFKLTNF